MRKNPLQVKLNTFLAPQSVHFVVQKVFVPFVVKEE